jgi:DNA-binding SARP family transcriptional activator
VATDVAEFEAVPAEAGRARTRHDPARAAGLLGRALELWRGSALADVDAGPAMRAQAEPPAELRLTAVEDKAAADLAPGRYREALAELDRHLAEHPFRERIRELRMRALIGLDCPAEALACYESGRRILRTKPGVEPSHPGDLAERKLVQSLGVDGGMSAVLRRWLSATCCGWPAGPCSAR